MSGHVTLTKGTFSIYYGILSDQVGTLLTGAGKTTLLQLATLPSATLTADANSGQKNVVVDDASGFTAGDSVLMRASNYWGRYIIDSIASQTITLTTNLAQSYTTANSAKIIGYGNPSIAITANDCEVANIKLDGNRDGRGTGLITNLKQGTNDGSSALTFPDSCICIGFTTACSRVKVHDLYMDNFPEHAIFAKGEDVALDNIYIYRNHITDTGDKAILGRFTGTGTFGHFEVRNNYIDGCGKVDLTDRTAANTSWGDGIQCHTTGPRQVIINDNIVKDVARTGIWLMQSDASEVYSQVLRNQIIDVGQKIFHTTDEGTAEVSGIHCNRAHVDISHNQIDCGFTSGVPRAESRCVGIRFNVSTADGGDVVDSIISHNLIKGCYGNTTATACIYLGAGDSVICQGNVARLGDIGASLLNMEELKLLDNDFGGLDISFGNATYNNILVSRNRARYVSINTSGTYNDVEVSGNDLVRTTYGGLVFTPTTTSNKETDIIWARSFRDVFPSLPLSSTTGVHTAITGTGASQDITTNIVNPGGRNCTITTTDVSSPSGTVTLKGMTAMNTYETEDFTISAGATVEGNVAFSTITTIVIPAGVSVDDTVSVGTGNKLGLTNRIGQTNSVRLVWLDGVLSAGDTSNESATYHTYDVSTILGQSTAPASFEKTYISASEMDPGAAGATWTAPDANTTGGYQLNAVGEILYFQAMMDSDWNGTADPTLTVWFEVNVDNTGGGDADTVDLQAIFTYKGEGDTSIRTQTVEEATTVGKSAQYKMWKVTFTLDADDSGNELENDDIIGIELNLETDTSEVDDIIVCYAEFKYHKKETIEISYRSELNKLRA